MQQQRHRLSRSMVAALLLPPLLASALLSPGCDKSPPEQPPAGAGAAQSLSPKWPRLMPRAGPGMSSRPVPSSPQTAPAGAATRRSPDEPTEEKLAYLAVWLARHGVALPDAPIADLPRDESERLMRYMPVAAREGDTRALEGFLAAGGDANRRENGFGRPLLNEAADAAQPAVVEFLLKHGADPNLVSAVKASALMLAAGNGDLASARLLLNAGAKIDLADKSGLTALMAAISNGRDEMVAELIARHASLSMRTTGDGRGRTACDFARERYDARILKMLEAAGACAPVPATSRESDPASK